MFVSKRILFFKSKENGYMLFCGNSNSFYQIDDENVPVIQKMIDTGSEEGLPEDIRKEFVKSGVLLNESDEEFFNRLKFSSYLTRFSKKHLSLTIAPTMACNFKCVYCYEGSRVKNVTMTQEVMDGVVEFIKKSECKNLSITWYGGEPLCAWDKILDFNKRIEELSLKSFTQDIVTNGSLLDDEKINYMFEKQFRNIQITLDGCEEIHNKCRPMKNGKNSFQTIMSNLDLISKIYKEKRKKIPISIRVNISETNADEYYQLYKILHDTYENLLNIYPAFVTKNDEVDCHASSCFTFEREAEFILKLSKEKGIITNKLFPERNKLIGCGAQIVNNYVISPNGDLYKCWEDISNETKIVGNVITGFKDRENNNYNFIINSTGFEVDNCKYCLFLYSCMGGCPRFRINNTNTGKEINPVCAVIKNKPEEFLETFYELNKKCKCCS